MAHNKGNPQQHAPRAQRRIRRAIREPPRSISPFEGNNEKSLIVSLETLTQLCQFVISKRQLFHFVAALVSREGLTGLTRAGESDSLLLH